MNAELQLQTGTVKFYNTAKGYGFIIMDNGSKDLFFHITGVSKYSPATFQANDRVQFEIIEEKRGLKAVNITRQ